MKYIYRLIFSLLASSPVLVFADLRNDIIPNSRENPTALSSIETGTGLLDSVLLFIKDSLF